MGKYVKNLKEFLSLDYKLEIIPFEDLGEKGFVVKSPELKGLEVFGETIEEALDEVVEAKKALYEIYKRKEMLIKYPETYKSEDEQFSGRMTIRIPTNLHRSIFEYANENKISLNTGIIQLLNDGINQRNLDETKEGLMTLIDKINKSIPLSINYVEAHREIQYNPSIERTKSQINKNPFKFIEGFITQ